jgi:hypothetical protein
MVEIGNQRGPRLLNEDIEDLYARVGIGTTVIVLPSAKGTAS